MDLGANTTLQAGVPHYAYRSSSGSSCPTQVVPRWSTQAAEYFVALGITIYTTRYVNEFHGPHDVIKLRVLHWRRNASVL